MSFKNLEIGKGKGGGKTAGDTGRGRAAQGTEGGKIWRLLSSAPWAKATAPSRVSRLHSLLSLTHTAAGVRSETGLTCSEPIAPHCLLGNVLLSQNWKTRGHLRHHASTHSYFTGKETEAQRRSYSESGLMLELRVAF